MAVRDDVQWIQVGKKNENLILVTRSLYDVYTLLTTEEFRASEPAVEALAIVSGHKMAQLVRRDVGGMECYYPVGESVAVGDALLVIPLRETIEDLED